VTHTILLGEEVEMAAHARCTFKVAGWEEKPYAELENGGKLTQASVKQSFSGDIEGEGSVEWLMCYRPDETVEFIGLQRIDGRIGERSGSFVLLQTDGTFDGNEARANLTIVPGSGGGELRGLRGEGRFSAPHGSEGAVTLHYEFE
jgi:Protein of unknown function (DUF3224)